MVYPQTVTTWILFVKSLAVDLKGYNLSTSNTSNWKIKINFIFDVDYSDNTPWFESQYKEGKDKDWFKFSLRNLKFIPKYEIPCFTIPSNLRNTIIFSDPLTQVLIGFYFSHIYEGKEGVYNSYL